MREPGDREARNRTSGGLQIARGDFCGAFEQDEGRLFSARECWYCRYGDFGIFTEHPTQNGVCRFKTTMNGTLDSCAKRCARGLNEKQGEETI